MNTNILHGFFAYPSEPPVISEYVHAAVKQINKTNYVHIKLWEECRVGGKLVIQEICKEIDKVAIFCADLTGLNTNVMFELGYAIAKDKRIWVSIDKSFSQTKKEFDQLKILTTVGYADCSNSIQIYESFLKDAPYSDIENTILRTATRSYNPSSSSLLFLKSRHDNEASIQVTSLLENCSLPLIIDDPRESAVQPLAWYVNKVLSALGIICHLTSPEREGARLDNARHALIAGIASVSYTHLTLPTN